MDKLPREIPPFRTRHINGSFAAPTNNQSLKNWKLGMEYDIFLVGYLT
jgi:hypothetical protein